MKNLFILLSFGFLSVCFFTSCETETKTETDNYLADNNFHLLFSDSTVIHQNDVYYYDSSTHIFFLNKDLEFRHQPTFFKVYAENEKIYQGTIHPCAFSSLPLSIFSISDCFFYGKNCIQVDCQDESNDLRNDPRIINSLENNNLLRNGISCTIDTIQVISHSDFSEVFCGVTIKNHDKANYYILHPETMGELDFVYYTGGLFFRNNETNMFSFLRWSVSHPDWANISMNDFYLLESEKEVSFSFRSSDYYKMETGDYTARFRFMGIYDDQSDLNPVQPNGRIWIGESLTLSNILVK
ncbi:MAG: hypothetical protein JXJ22_09410 [Bacteroidales bacterium]|nr:hypothetical protein [Bacteroidales bacterium]